MLCRLSASVLALTLLLLFSARRALPQEEAKPVEKPGEHAVEKAAEKEASLVQITLKGFLADSLPQENPFGPNPLHFKGLLDIIRKAKADPQVAAMYLKVDSPFLGLAKTRELLSALKDFRSSGKKIYTFAEDAQTLELALLSAASRVEMPESAMLFLPGVSAESLYMKSFFEKIGVRFLVTHIGDYKSAFENFSRDEMSPALREVLEVLVESVYQSILETISSNRSIPKEKVAEALDRAILSAAEAQKLGLIDEVAHREHFWEDVKADLDVKKVKILKNYGRKSVQLDTQNPFALFSILIQAFAPPAKRSSPRPKIAIVYANGMITSGKSQASPFGGEFTLGSDTMVEAIKTAADDATVKAIVLRIDSPGGSGTASDAIWRAVVDAKGKKPVVASMSDVAASGGYYIAMGANRIIAEPETITGSIGVVSALINLKGTLDLLGIHVERISRGKNADVFSPFADPAKVSTEPLRQVMESFCWQFVEKAAAGRGKTKDEIHAVAQGRVWTGRDALQKGLVDELGGLDRALEAARELASVPANEKLEMLELPAPPNIFESLSETFGMESLEKAGGVLGLTAPEMRALSRLPELRGAIQRAALLLEAARDRLVLLMPFEVKVLRR